MFCQHLERQPRHRPTPNSPAGRHDAFLLVANNPLVLHQTWPRHPAETPRWPETPWTNLTLLASSEGSEDQIMNSPRGDRYIRQNLCHPASQLPKIRKNAYCVRSLLYSQWQLIRVLSCGGEAGEVRCSAHQFPRTIPGYKANSDTDGSHHRITCARLRILLNCAGVRRDAQDDSGHWRGAMYK